MCLLVTSLPAMLSSLWGQMGQAFLKGNSELQGFILLTSYRIKPSEFSKCLYYFISILPPSFDGETIEKKSTSLLFFLLETMYTIFFLRCHQLQSHCLPQAIGLYPTLSLSTSNIHPPSLFSRSNLSRF